MFPSCAVHGCDAASKPKRYMKSTNINRYYNTNREVFKAHLLQIAFQTSEASSGEPLLLLARVYDRVYIDEVQDLGGWIWKFCGP